jgi:hypothetical protein
MTADEGGSLRAGMMCAVEWVEFLSWGNYHGRHMTTISMPHFQLLRGAILAVVVFAAAVTAHAQDGVRMSPPYVEVAPFAEFSRRAIAMRDSIVARARAQLGRRYRHGGETPARGFDCSGLVSWVLATFRVDVPRTAAQQSVVGAEVPMDTSALRPGDLLTFGRGRRVTHIGIYVGNGRFVHASSRAGRVVESDLLRPAAPGIKPWRGVRRIVIADTAAAPVAGSS